MNDMSRHATQTRSKVLKIFFFARRQRRISRILAVLYQEKVIHATPEVLRIERSQVSNPLKGAQDLDMHTTPQKV